MPLKEPVEFFGIIKKITKKIGTSNDIDVHLHIEVSDYAEDKNRVVKSLADITADEYFIIRIDNGV